jgi:hypothetical protein
MSELETRSRAFICNCSRCSSGMFCRGRYGRRGECGRNYGREHLGRRDGRDRSIMTTRRLCKPVFCGNLHDGCFTGTRAQVGESLADTVGPELKVRGRANPFKIARRALIWDFAFPSSSSSSRTHPLRSEIFRVLNSAAACASSPPKTLLSRCRTGRVPMFPAKSFSILSRRASFLHSPMPSSRSTS